MNFSSTYKRNEGKFCFVASNRSVLSSVHLMSTARQAASAKGSGMRNVCLFAHFDPLGKVEPYVSRYVQAIRSCGFEVVFISASTIPDSDVETLRHLCVDVILRPNVGLDFGSWAVGYAQYGHQIEGELLLANDSVYGPIGSLDVALQRLRDMRGDVRGMVESFEHARHIQSWFVLLSPDAHRSVAFRETLEQEFTKFSKQDIIEKGEIGLSKRLRQSGLEAVALFSMAHRADEGAILRYNPTHFVWKELIEQYGVPFIKVELLRDNPCSISNLSQWRTALARHAPELIPMVEMHLSRSGQRLAAAERSSRRFSAFVAEAFIKRDLQLDRSGNWIGRKLNGWIFEKARTSRTRFERRARSRTQQKR